MSYIGKESIRISSHVHTHSLRLHTGQTHLRHANPPQRTPPIHILPLISTRLQIPLVQLRQYRARQQCITPDPVLAQRHGATLHQAQHAGFCGRVVALLAAADEGGDGGYADDAAALRGLGAHLEGCGLGGVEGAGKVGGYSVVPEGWCYAGSVLVWEVLWGVNVVGQDIV